MLPTHLSTSALSGNDVLFSLGGFLLFYTLLLIAEVYLMLKYVRLGPSSLGTGKYALESANPDAGATGVNAPVYAAALSSKEV
jgi:cytochrome d ubiquinol oxidase subunit I